MIISCVHTQSRTLAALPTCGIATSKSHTHLRTLRSDPSQGRAENPNGARARQGGSCRSLGGALVLSGSSSGPPTTGPPTRAVLSLVQQTKKNLTRRRGTTRPPVYSTLPAPKEPATNRPKKTFPPSAVVYRPIVRPVLFIPNRHAQTRPRCRRNGFGPEIMQIKMGKRNQVRWRDRQPTRSSTVLTCPP